MHKALSIPEILSHTFAFLGKGDLVHCTIVSKTWHPVAHSSLWKTICFSDLTRGMPTELFRQNAHLVADLQMTSTEQLHAYAMHCARLHSLVLPIDHHYGMSGGDVMNLVQQNTATLRSLKMQLYHIQPTTLLQAVTGMRHLKRIELDIRVYLESLPRFVHQLLKVCPLLESLVLAGTGEHLHSTRVGNGGSSSNGEEMGTDSPGDDSTTAANSWCLTNRQPRQHHLRELSISFPACRDEFAFYIPLLQQCPDLVRMQLPPIPPYLLSELYAFLRAKVHLPIEFLDLSVAHVFKDEEMAGLLQACPPNSLRHLDLTRREIGPKTLEATLACHSRSLERVNMTDIRCSGPSVVREISPWIHSLLSTCPRLTSFKIRAHSMDFVYLSADHILQDGCGGQCNNLDLSTSSSGQGMGGWACAHTLRELQVPIGGLCQPTSQWGWTPCKSQDHAGVCMGKHARVFERLAALTRLERLDVTRSVQGPTLPDWLEWRMTSGLGHLSKLTRLQELTIPRHAVLGQEESEWMKAQWPTCKLLYR